MKCIKHILNKDVCFQLLDLSSNETHYLVKGLWINLGMGSGIPFPIGSGSKLAIETIKIKREDMKNWKPYELRTA